MTRRWLMWMAMLGAAGSLTMLVMVVWQALQTSRTVIISVAPAASATWTVRGHASRPDPVDPSAYYRPKLDSSGSVEGLLHCRSTAVEQCTWVTRHL